jgi:hypothetical protein
MPASRIPQWIFGQVRRATIAFIDPRDIALPKRIGRSVARPHRFELDERKMADRALKEELPKVTN